MRNPQRPKLLFLAWNFPPVQTIASVRTWNVAKHLHRMGWDVTVVTPIIEIWRHLDSIDKVNADIQAQGIRRILTGHYLRFLNPVHFICWNEGLGWFLTGTCRRIARSLGVDDGIGWIRAAERTCRTLNPSDVDLILSSGPPFAAFMLAERLANMLSRPYVLDYRDLWTESRRTALSLPSMANRIEARLVTGAAAVTAVFPSLAASLDSRFGIGPKLRVVTNGYDSEDLRAVKRLSFDHFAIVYAGIFYPPERIITPVLQALKRVDSSGQTV